MMEQGLPHFEQIPLAIRVILRLAVNPVNPYRIVIFKENR